MLKAQALRLGAAVFLGLLVGCGGAAPEEDATQADQKKELPPREVVLGEYRFRAFNPASNTQTRFDFTLAGLADDAEVSLLQQEMQKKEMRIRDRVMIVARESSVEELEDPDLLMFRRRLLKEVNRLVEKGQFDDIYVSHYRVKTR